MAEQITAILFDIDGTLVDTHGAGRDAFEQALNEVFGGDEDLRFINFAGATDADIFRGAMMHRGLRPTRAQEREFFRQLPLKLEKTITEHLRNVPDGRKERFRFHGVARVTKMDGFGRTRRNPGGYAHFSQLRRLRLRDTESSNASNGMEILKAARTMPYWR